MAIITSASPHVVPLEMDPAFLQAITYYACTSSAFWERIGQHVPPATLQSEEARFLFSAARQVVSETTCHPEHRAIILQRLHTDSTEGGKITLKQLAACRAYLDDVDVDDLPGLEQCISALTPSVKRILFQQAHLAGLSAIGPDGEKAAEKAVKLYGAAEGVGKAGASKGLGVDGAMFDGLPVLRGLTKMSTRIMELDMILDGGLTIGESFFVVGDASEGKSFLAIHLFCAALEQRLHACYATLELSARRVQLRAMARLSGIPINAILRGGPPEVEAKRRVQWLIDNGHLGRGSVKDFPAEITKLSHIFSWVEEQERLYGPVHLLCIDADEHVGFDKEEASDYSGRGKVYAGMRSFAQGPDSERQPDKMRIVGTNSQAKIRKRQENYIKDHNDAADSARKGRIADVGVTINVRGDERDTILFNVSRNRNGRTGITPELPTDWPCARPVVLTGENYPWVRQSRAWGSLWVQKELL